MVTENSILDDPMELAASHSYTEEVSISPGNKRNNYSNIKNVIEIVDFFLKFALKKNLQNV